MQRTKTRPLEDQRWSAVHNRDRNADGTFYYAVLTTGIYCRPSCAARRPLRGNVRFFASPAEAEAAGFRPCKRCKPRAADGDVAARKIAAACRAIERADTSPSLAELAQAAGLSAHHFHRLFKSVTGVTPKAFAQAERDKRLSRALRESRSVTEAIYEAGFASSGRFYAATKETLGMQPTDFRRGGEDITISFAIAPCALGLLLLAATEKGICAIFLGDTPDDLRDDLRRRFPKATLQEAPGEGTLSKLITDALMCIETPARAASLPLDIQGTAFQVQVWTALRQIPPGETATYAQIAQRIGRPKAVRAVGAACGANPVAVIIPCHRVVGSDGKLTGYRWGTDRKRALLKREQS